MPTLNRACQQPGCPSRAQRGSTFCTEHRPARGRGHDQRRGNSAARGYDHRWRALRLRFLKTYPVCVGYGLPGGRLCERPAEEVDHIVPIRRGGGRLDWSNLQPLCKSCHSRKTANERTLQVAGDY